MAIRRLVRLIPAVSLTASAVAEPVPAFRAGCASCAFNRFTACEAVEKTSQAGDIGGSGSSLVGAGSRFSIPSLVESVIIPDKTVSPIFRWTLVTKKDASVVAGLITGETSAEIELLLPAGIRQTVRKEEVAKRERQDRSPMPEGLTQTPAELRDLIACLTSLKDDK